MKIKSQFSSKSSLRSLIDVLSHLFPLIVELLNCRQTGCFCDSKLKSCVIERKTEHEGGKVDFEYAYCISQSDWVCAPPSAEGAEEKNDRIEENPHAEDDAPNEEDNELDEEDEKPHEE